MFLDFICLNNLYMPKPPRGVKIANDGIKIYGNNEKPTNGEFIALVADKMLLEA